MGHIIANTKRRVNAVIELYIYEENIWAKRVGMACFALVVIYLLFGPCKDVIEYMCIRDTSLINQEMARIADSTIKHVFGIDVNYFVECFLWLGVYSFLLALVFAGYQDLLLQVLHKIPSNFINSDFPRLHGFSARFVLLLNWISLGLELILMATLWHSKHYTEVKDDYLEIISSVVALRAILQLLMLFETSRVNDLFEEVLHETEYLQAEELDNDEYLQAELDDEEYFHEEDSDDTEYWQEMWIDVEAQLISSI